MASKSQSSFKSSAKAVKNSNSPSRASKTERKKKQKHKVTFKAGADLGNAV